MSAAVVESAREGPRPSAPSRAAALLSLLDEPRAELRAHALSALSAIVDVEWSAVASSVATIEALYEDEEFGARLDAAMLASKVRILGARRRSKRRWTVSVVWGIWLDGLRFLRRDSSNATNEIGFVGGGDENETGDETVTDCACSFVYLPRRGVGFLPPGRAR